MDRRHSGYGIASLAGSLASAALTFALMIAAAALELSTPGGIREDSLEAVVLGLLLVALLLLDLFSLGLGLGGLAQRERKRVFAALGTVFSTATLAATVFVILLGLDSRP